MPTVGSGLIEMFSAEEFGGDTIDVVYTGIIDALDFALTDFRALPSDTSPADIQNINPTKLQMIWAGSIETDTTLEYTGNVPSIKTPQTIAIS